VQPLPNNRRARIDDTSYLKPAATAASMADFRGLPTLPLSPFLLVLMIWFIVLAYAMC
jgi:hypothetical protein